MYTTESLSLTYFEVECYDYFSNMQVLQGNKDRNTVVLHLLAEPINARYIRLHPKTYHGYTSLRMELLGCPSGNRYFPYLAINKQGLKYIDTTALDHAACSWKYRFAFTRFEAEVNVLVTYIQHYSHLTIIFIEQANDVHHSLSKYLEEILCLDQVRTKIKQNAVGALHS